MANPEHIAKLKEGAKAWNEWRLASSIAEIDLSGANLGGTNLIRADLNNADLRDADLSYANLTTAILAATNLNNANLSGTILIGANLASAKVTTANLTSADLRGANLRRANLCGANLDRAKFNETLFINGSLKGALGLDTCVHEGPSTIDHRTLARSGVLPIVFLRGCGLPDNFIDYLPSLLNQAIQFFSCFISYSTDNQEFADRLHADLQSKGVRCWFAPHDIKGGKKIHEQIDEAIRVYDKLLLILSDASMNSEWVSTEIAKARKREKEDDRRMLFPVKLVSFESVRDWECFDADTGKDSAREIREYFIPDFSNWKDHDSYQKAFARLLRDLKADKARAYQS